MNTQNLQEVAAAVNETKPAETPAPQVQPVAAPPGPPYWFDHLLGSMLALYPSVSVRPNTLGVWWGYLCGLPPQALVQGFLMAPQNSSPGVVPSAELVRQCTVAWMQEQGGQKL